MTRTKLWIITIIFLIHAINIEAKYQGVECGAFKNTVWKKIVNIFLSFGSNNLSNPYKCKTYTNSGDYENKIISFYEEVDAEVRSTHTKVKSFSSRFCHMYSVIEEFILANTTVETLDEELLKECDKLKFFRVFSNKISELSPKLLVKNTKLKVIWLHKNELTALPKDFFISQRELEILWLNDNKMFSLPPSIFSSLEKLKELKLSDNNLRAINSMWFENLHDLEVLDLSGFVYEDLIERLLSRKESESSYYGRASEMVKKGYINRNLISELPRGAFSGLKNLKELHLNYNILSTIHSDSFGIHNQLTKLYLHNNIITSIDEEFINNTALTTLNILDNKCANFTTQNRNEIKSKLTECFSNYRPRPREDCGVATIGIGNIIGGRSNTKGSYPWIAALVYDNGEYFCGGTLVSDRKVITAAHCIQDKGQPVKLLPNELKVLLGVYNLSSPYESDRRTFTVHNIHVNPGWDYKAERFDADIAVLILNERIEFNLFIQPVCIMKLSNEAIEISSGIVIGYGKSEDETKIHENIPKIIDIPVHSNEQCFLKFPSLARISSNRTFCGGSADGTGVCLGDSGSGLFVSFKGAYYLRGIVSSSIRTIRYGCDVNKYSVFTDILKFSKWIENIDKSED